MSDKRKLLWVGDGSAPVGVCEATGEDWDISPCSLAESIGPQLNDASLVVVSFDSPSENIESLARLLEDLKHSSAVAVFVLAREDTQAWQMLSRHPGQFVCVSKDISPDELATRLATAAELQPAISNLHSELSAVKASVGQSFDELTEEMRLAAQLQRDFLPRRLPEVGNVRFGVLYHAAGWVSGDIYDIDRLDETHLGFYIADAVGHGMPAALLTMFIKKALQTKRIVRNGYQLLAPHVSLGELNVDICQQNLSSCQFCTAVYCVLDTSDLMLTYSRAGHPQPILIRKGGILERLEVPGSLLGIFPEETYQSSQVQLYPGDRLIIYSDGVESLFCQGMPGTPLPLQNRALELAEMSREGILLDIADKIEQGDEELLKDDVTVMVVDIEE